jgi:hypothetical protein
MNSSNGSAYVGLQVRLKVDIADRLKAGAIGVCVADTSSEYPNSADSQYPLSVVFVGLGKPTTYCQPIDGIEPSSVPHHNAVAMRLREVELV